MKVTRATTRILSTPADNPLVVGVPVGDATREFVTLELDTDEGIQGIGLTFFGGPLTRALKEAVDALCGMVIGQDPMPVEQSTVSRGKTTPGGSVTRGRFCARWELNCRHGHA